jgi:WD40 repeat protein
LLRRARRDEVTIASFAGTGRVILGRSNGELSMWEGENDRSIAKLNGVIERLVVQGRWVAAISGDQVVTVDLVSGNVRSMVGSAVAYSLAFAEDGTLYVGDTAGHVTVTRPDGSQGATTIKHSHGIIMTIVISGNLLITAGGDGTVRTWSLDGHPVQVFAGHAADVLAVRLDRSQQRLISTSIDGTARLWNLQTGQELARMVHRSWVTDAVFTPGGHFVFTASYDGDVQLWEVNTGHELERFPAQGTTTSGGSLAIDPELHLLMIGGGRKVVLHVIDGLDWN